MAHELYHADKALNASLADFLSGDDPTNALGAAQQFGERVSREAPDFSTDSESLLSAFFASPLVTPTSILFSGAVHVDGVLVDFSACGRRFCPH